MTAAVDGDGFANPLPPPLSLSIPQRAPGHQRAEARTHAPVTGQAVSPVTRGERGGGRGLCPACRFVSRAMIFLSFP